MNRKTHIKKLLAKVARTWQLPLAAAVQFWRNNMRKFFNIAAMAGMVVGLSAYPAFASQETPTEAPDGDTIVSSYCEVVTVGDKRFANCFFQHADGRWTSTWQPLYQA